MEEKVACAKLGGFAELAIPNIAVASCEIHFFWLVSLLISHSLNKFAATLTRTKSSSSLL